MISLLESRWNLILFIKRKQRLRLCKFIASRYARRTGEDPLWPQALPGGPSARWHKPQLVLSVKIDTYLMASRGLCSASRNMRKKLSGAFFSLLGNLANSGRPLGRRSIRAYGVVAHKFSIRINCTVARIMRFRPTCSPNDKSENRPGGSHIVLVQPEQIFDRMTRAAQYI